MEYTRAKTALLASWPLCWSRGFWRIKFRVQDSGFGFGFGVLSLGWRRVGAENGLQGTYDAEWMVITNTSG